jgi:hypothetical protein
MPGGPELADSVVDVAVDVSTVVVVPDVEDVSNVLDVLAVVVNSLDVRDSVVLDELVSTGCSVSDALVGLPGSWVGVDDSMARVVCRGATSEDRGGVNAAGSDEEIGNRGISHELGAGPSISVYVGWMTSVK